MGQLAAMCGFLRRLAACRRGTNAPSSGTATSSTLLCNLLYNDKITHSYQKLCGITLQPIADAAGVKGLTYQALRRTFATHFQRYGSPKDAQAQLRHAKLEMTGHYMKHIPETVRAAVEKMDAEISAQPTVAVPPPGQEQIQ